MSNEIKRIRNCIECRENLGLTYHFCDSNIYKNIESINKIEISSDAMSEPDFDEEKLLFYKLGEYKEECQDGKFIDTDHMDNGKRLIQSGIGLLSGSAVMIGLSPLVLSWSLTGSGDDLADLFLFIPKLFTTLIVVAADVGLCAGGIATIKIGNHKRHEFDKLQKELPKFQRDIKYLPCVQIDF